MEIQLVRERLVLWLREKVSEAGARGLVVGLSGGVDSAVVAASAREAFPQEQPCGVDAVPEARMRMPATPRSRKDRRNTLLSRSRWTGSGKSWSTGSTTPWLPKKPGPMRTRALRMAAINVKPRLRMTSLHYIARAKGYLVAGATNRSELTVGLFHEIWRLRRRPHAARGVGKNPSVGAGPGTGNPRRDHPQSAVGWALGRTDRRTRAGDDLRRAGPLPLVRERGAPSSRRALQGSRRKATTRGGCRQSLRSEAYRAFRRGMLSAPPPPGGGRWCTSSS